MKVVLSIVQIVMQVSKFTNKYIISTGADPRGGGLKKIAPSGGRREIFGVFRVKNHDFMPKNHIFSNCGGRRKFCLGYFIHHRLVKSYKNHSTVCSLTDLYLVASITSLKFSSTFSDPAIVLSMFISTFVFCDSV